MVLVSVDESTRQELLKLDGAPLAQTAAPLVKAATRFLLSGAKRSTIENAAVQLGMAVEELEGVILACARFLSECARVDASEREVGDSAAVLKLSKGVQAALCENYAAAKPALRSLLGAVSLELPRYDGVRWRLDVEVGSRCLRNQVAPFFVLDVATRDSSRAQKVAHHFVELDPLSLKYVTAQLEAALAESKTAAARRVMRNIK